MAHGSHSSYAAFSEFDDMHVISARMLQCTQTNTSQGTHNIHGFNTTAQTLGFRRCHTSSERNLGTAAALRAAVLCRQRVCSTTGIHKPEIQHDVDDVRISVLPLAPNPTRTNRHRHTLRVLKQIEELKRIRKYWQARTCVRTEFVHTRSRLSCG